jgi:hypothetical protein
MPGFESALAAGDVTAGYVDAIANATRNLDEPTLAEFHASQHDLLADASRQSVDTFGRTCRDLARAIIAHHHTNDTAAEELEAQRNASNTKTWTDQATGMCHTHLELDPVRHRQLWTAIEATRAKLKQHDGNRHTPWTQLTIDAIINTVTTGAGNSAPEISVLIDLDTLIDGVHATTTCETDTGIPLPVSTIRRMACDADIVPIVLNGAGRVLDVGRSQRTATADQRRAIRAMHQTCVHPDCTVTINACRIHDTKQWARDRGETNLDVLAPVCEPHHHLIHEGGWTLTITPNRIATWTRPDNTIYWTGPTTDRTQPAA